MYQFQGTSNFDSVYVQVLVRYKQIEKINNCSIKTCTNSRVPQLLTFMYVHILGPYE